MINDKESLSRLIQTLKRKGYEVFLDDSKDYNLNIVGVRNDHPVLDIFNDWIVIFWRHKGAFYYGCYPATTLPGEYYLIDKLLNRKGAAILVPGQYRGAYKIGMHRNKYPALVQSKQVTVYRDGDKDKEYDYIPETKHSGWFGINLHRAYKNGHAPKVGKTSAGCQVFQRSEDFSEFMAVCSEAKRLWGNRFTYTLIEEKDLTG